MTVDAVRGSFPLCDRCAPACPTCGLPMTTAKVLAFQNSVGAKAGKGVCPQHEGLGPRLKAIFKRTFNIG
jgi:hypothetical protein